MISALDSGASTRGSGPVGDIVSCSCACHFTVTVPLCKQVYKWVPANLLLRGYPCDELASHPGGMEILLIVSCYDNLNKLRADESLGSYADFAISLPMATLLTSNRRKVLPNFQLEKHCQSCRQL